MFLRPYLSKINFCLGNNPFIEKNENWRKFVPEPFDAVIIITADFELAWAWRYSTSNENSFKFALNKASLERENIPYILELCEEFRIPITWATVGHLFLKECRKINGRVHSNIPAVKNYKGQYWNFSSSDWFEYDPCSNYKEAPEWYAPDLIEMILKSVVKHEIGCHTFSHINCSDEVCPIEIFKAEIFECRQEAAKFGIELKSFVHPGHTIGNLSNLKEQGFTSYQTDPGNILGYPVKHRSGLLELKRTSEFVYRNEWTIDYHIYRYKKIIDRAIENNSVCNFWFHPSFPREFVSHILPKVFEHLHELKEKVMITTIDNYISQLEKIK